MSGRFLAVYDYGQGGVWAYIVADSEAQIAAEYPELAVVKERPPWMTDELSESFPTIDIDDREDEFLAALRAERQA